MKKTTRYWIFTCIWIMATVAICFYVAQIDMVVVYPKGWVGIKQRDLFIIATLLMLIVVIPVFILAVWIPYRYRDGNTKAKFRPDHDHNIWAEVVWWGVPLVIITVLGVMNWMSSFTLDPYRPLRSDKKPVKIQVIATDWKWLFIYPEESIATVNYIQIPVNTPIDFEITADAPMNSFWIPELGGQIFAMPGMRTKLHLIADEEGEFRGCSANLSGTGFSTMVFTAKASSENEYASWVKKVHSSGKSLTWDSYQDLAKPSSNHPVVLYKLRTPELFRDVIEKYAVPKEQRSRK